MFKLVFYIFPYQNFLAACTGMRIGEVLGLRGECVFADFIRVQGQHGQSGYGPTKTRTTRNIPLSPAIMDGLVPLTLNLPNLE
jgi:integrase